VPHSLPTRIALLSLILLASSLSASSEPLFEIQEIPIQGRTVAAELADLDGDGVMDLVVFTLDGIPPDEERNIHVYLRGADGVLPATPSHLVPLPRWSAVYDIGEIKQETPGDELVVLQPDGVTVLSLASAKGKRWHHAAPGATTMGVADDERGLEPYKLIYRDFGAEPWLLIPQIGQLTALSAAGKVMSTLAIPRRANYLVQPNTELVSLESNLQVFLDVPKLSLGDVNGDGRTDISFATRHEIHVFLRRPDGRFPFEPDRRLPLQRVTPRDHIRGSGGVTSEIRDVDGDGRVDLLVSHVMGGVMDATTTTFLYLNRDGGWNLDQPHQTRTGESSWETNSLFDLDGDGRRELLRFQYNLSLLGIVETLLTRTIDIDIAAFRFRPEAGREGFEKKPFLKRSLSLPFSFETARFKGFLPTAEVDVNADGQPDLVTSGGGEKFEVHLGKPGGGHAKKTQRQKMSTAGIIRFADFSGDGLPDFVILDPHNFDVSIRLGRNLGAQPGTALQLRERK
jgi:hypothetical protein